MDAQPQGQKSIQATDELGRQLFNMASDAVRDLTSTQEKVGSKATPSPAPGEKVKENTNPYAGPVSGPVTVVDSKGNAIPVKAGEQVQGSKDGRFTQVKDAKGIETGTRVDGGLKPSTHPDPRAQKPHAHVPGKTNPDGNTVVADKLIRDYMKYDYGDDVVVKAQDQSGVEKPGTVVGISPVENAEQSRIFAYPIGTVLYTIKFGDGSDALLPEERLEPLVTEN